MTDIIVRLEQRYEQTAVPECDLIQEAALVIERLRNELADVRADANLLRTENERLRALHEAAAARAELAQIEIERLRAELRLWSTQAEREVALLHNEVDRLARGWATPTYAIRRALEPKP